MGGDKKFLDFEVVKGIELIEQVEAGAIKEIDQLAKEADKILKHPDRAVTSIFSTIFRVLTCCLPEWARNFILNVYHSSIPETMWFEDVGALPHFYKNMITLLYNAGYFAIFFYFAKTSYDSNRGTFFVSLDPGAGECEEIGRPTTGDFLISSSVNGSYAYESSPLFDFNRSAYSLSLDSYQCKHYVCN
jgi:hypothetical protein